MMTQATTVAVKYTPATRPIAEALDELKREIQVRQRCYPRWVQEGRLSATDAKDRGERLDSAFDYLWALSEAMTETEARQELADEMKK